MIELTLVMPFLIALGLGTVEYGQAFYHNHLITNGLRDGARYLARVDDPAAEAAKGRDIAATGEIGGTTNRVSWWSSADVTVSVLNVANPVDPNTGERLYRGSDPIKVVRVSTNVNHPGFGFLAVIGISTPLNINVAHEERVIGD